MKNLATKLSDHELLSSLKSLAAEERQLNVKVLWHLREVEKRMLYAKLGFKSLYDYVSEELGYSDGAAHRRIASMRLLKELPELQEKVETGALPLSTLALAHSFFRSEKILEASQKREIIADLEKLSHREVQKKLLAQAAHPEKLFGESLKSVSPNHHKMSLLLDEVMLKDLEELRNLMSSAAGSLTLQQVVHFAIKKALEFKRPKPPRNQGAPAQIKGAKSSLNSNSNSINQSPSPPPSASPSPSPALEMKPQITARVQVLKQRSRHIPIEIRRQVWARDEGCCTYRDPTSGRLCASKSGLNLDHIVDFASGGEHSLNNLRLRCRNHNTLAAVERFGTHKMAQFVSSLS